MNKYLVVGLVVCLFLVGCGAQELYFCKDGSLGGDQVATKNKVVYYCPDGTKTVDPSVCDFERPVTIDQKAAEERAENFVSGFVDASGWDTTLVNTYREDGKYYGQLVVSKRDEQPFETTVVVDGQKGTVTCQSNCVYITG